MIYRIFFLFTLLWVGCNGVSFGADCNSHGEENAEMPYATFLEYCLNFSRLDQATKLTLQAITLIDDPTDLQCIENNDELISETFLQIRHAPITDLRPLATLTALQTFELVHTHADPEKEPLRLKEFLAPLKMLKNLKKLHLIEVQHLILDDLSCLKDMVQLESLSISRNHVRDMKPLMELINLKSLSLPNNKIEDIRPIIGLHDLEYLKLSGNPIDTVRAEVRCPTQGNISDVVRDYCLRRVNAYFSPSGIPIPFYSRQ